MVSDGDEVDRSNVNGGFPLPLEDQPVRLVRSHHAACGGDTRVRLPRAVPARAVRRVVCGGCAQAYEPEQVEDVPVAAPAASPRSIPWRWLTLPVAAAAVVG